MKIVCQSCSATYKIADDKVQGKKVFKIKCKKCGEDILVRGTDVQAPVEQPPAERPMEDESTRMMQSASETEAVWHAVINGDQQGPYTVDQLREMLAQGGLDAETYVWRDGFEGWLPMHEVAELSFLLTPPAAAPAYTPAPAPYAAQPSYAPAAAQSAPAPVHEEPEGDLFGGSTVAMQSPVIPPTGADLFSVPAPVAAPVVAAASVSMSAPAKARPSAKSLSGDLFAAEARAQEAARPLVPDAVPDHTEAPAAAAGGAGATGTRNENSVLFSLATLQQLSGGPANGNVAAPGNSPSDSSGLIDINKLAGALNSANGGRKAAVDDILSVGTSGLGSPLSAPMLMPVAVPVQAAAPADLEAERPQSANKTLLIGVLGAAAILAVGVVVASAMFFRNRPAENTNTGANVAMNTPTAAPAAPGGPLAAANAPPVAAPAPAAPAPVAPVAVAGAAGSPAPGAAANPAAPAAAPSNGGGAAAAHERPREHVTHTGGSESASAGAHGLAPMPGSSAPSAASSPRPAARSGGGGSVDDLMNMVAGGGASRPAPRPAPAASGGGGGGDLPATPSRTDVISAMHAVQPSVRSCGAGQGGMAMVTMVFAGSGRMTTATVGSPFSGTPVGTCVARAVRSAHLPSFSNSTFNVTYPFPLQ